MSGHKSIGTISLDGVAAPKNEWIEITASLPNLRKLEPEEDEPISDSAILNLQKALPNVKIQRGK